MIEYKSGDILSEPAFAVPVNLVGTMGAGLALKVAHRWPDCVSAYKAACRSGALAVGSVSVWHQPGGVRLFMTPTKVHWRSKSTALLVETSVYALLDECGRQGVACVAVPKLGCGLGGLRWSEVRPLIVRAAEPHPSLTVRIYV